MCNIHPFIPYAKNSPSCFLNILMRVADAIGIIRGASSAYKSDCPACEWASVLYRFH